MPPLPFRLSAVCALFLAAGCGGDSDASPTGSADACAAFARHTLADATLRTETVTTGTAPSGAALVPHCRVTGSMHPRTGVDGKPYAIGFELRLPDDWNGRFLFQGGGGNDGVVRPALGVQATTSPALNQGYAVVSTDAGHEGTDASFGLDPQARVDHAYNSYDKVAVAAKRLIQAYYDKPTEYSYFIGCSGGGRQGMMFTQRFPDYFDGVIAMAPAMTVARGAAIASAHSSIELTAIAPRNAEGAPILAKALTNADLGVLRDGILAQCDAKDGLADGLVSNPAACQFDIQQVQCAPDQTDACLTPQKVNTLARIFAEPRNSAGEALYAAWPWDAGVGHPANDWRGWKLGTAEGPVPNARNVTLIGDAMAHEFFTPPQPDFNILDFDFDRDPPRMDAYAAIYNTAADARLDAFKAAGGKLLMATGMADPIFSPLETIDYFERLQASHPADGADFSRLFLIPGMAHCQGGAATDRWDGLGALSRWVEQKQAPATIVASGTTVYPGRTRPLCAYPAYARYDGKGDPEKAESFQCVTP